MNICVNPGCCNVDTFTGDVCPLCHDVVTVDTGTYMAAIADRDTATEFVNTFHLDELESSFLTLN